MKSKSRIYLDYAATTPIDPRVLRAMNPYFGNRFGNPGSLHSFGQEAIAAVDASREAIAKAIGADFREIIFAGSATEANNLALRGVLKEYKIQNPEPGSSPRPRIIISSIEHESILETAKNLEGEGIDVVYLPVDRRGVVNLKKLKESLTKNTVLVSIIYANNEIGTIQPILELRKIVDDFKKEYYKTTASPWYPLLHTDASQAFQFLDCNVQHLGVDFMTLSAHKIYGPKGVGALYVKQNPESGIRNQVQKQNKKLLDAIILGGGQEFGLRSGTENVPAIVGFAKAVGLISHSRESENKKIAGLSNRLLQGIKKIYPKVKLAGGGERLPNILNIYFPDYAAQDLLTRFDLHGLAVSSGSACRSRAMESSYVLEALGYSKEQARSSVRFSLGRPTNGGEIVAALKAIKGALG